MHAGEVYSLSIASTERHTWYTSRPSASKTFDCLQLSKTKFIFVLIVLRVAYFVIYLLLTAPLLDG